MTGWSTKRLESLVSSSITYGVVKPGDYDSDGVKLIRGGDICRGKISNNLRTVSPLVSQQYQRTVLQGGELLVSLVGNPGEVALVPNELAGANLARQAGMVRLNDEVDPRFALYYFMSPPGVEQLMSKVMGSVQQVINLSDLKEVEITYPSPYEQRAIAAVLSSIDDKIDLLHRQNQTLEAMAATLFRQWFVEEAQEDWEEVSVGDYVELNRASIDKNYTHKLIEYLDTGSLTEGKIETLQLFFLDEAPSRAKRLVQHNDLLISTVRPDQRHYGIIKNPIENLVVSTGFCVLTCTKIDPHFIYLLLTNSEMTDYLHTIAEGSTSTYPSLKPSDIGAVTFQLPPDERLKEFAANAHNTWEKIERNHIQIRTLENLRDTLLPKLMSGEVRVA